MIIEAEKSQVSKLKTQEIWYVVPILVWKPENQESQWCEFQSESRRRLMP